MRILFATTAGEGHFGPMVPFARAAVAAGHDVAVAAPESFGSSVESTGLTFLPVGDVPGDLIGATMGRLQTVTREEANDIVMREIFGRLDTTWALPKMREIFAGFQPHLVFRDPTEFSSAVAAAETNTPTGLAAIGTGRLEQFARKTVRDVLAEFGLGDDSVVWDVPHISLLPASFDDGQFTKHFHRFRDTAGPANPLPDWWSGNKSPLVYVTFGSVAAAIGLFPRLYRSALDQLAELDVRVLMTTGRSVDPTELGTLPSNARVEQWVPQADVLAEAAAVVGHGGFGTTLGAIAAGVPSVVLPLFASDQYMNAERVSETGAGIGLPGLDSPVADPRSAGDLAAAVQGVLDDPRFRTRARQFAEEVANLPSVAEFPARLEAIRKPD